MITGSSRPEVLPSAQSMEIAKICRSPADNASLGIFDAFGTDKRDVKRIRIDPHAAEKTFLADQSIETIHEMLGKRSNPPFEDTRFISREGGPRALAKINLVKRKRCVEFDIKRAVPLIFELTNPVAHT